MNTVCKILLSLSLITACGEEKNPYKDGIVAKSNGSQTAANGTGTGTGTGSNGSAAGTGETLPGSNTQAADNAIAAGTLSGANLVCSPESAATMAKFKTELEVICLNGKPTTAFANLIANTYKGTGAAVVQTIKSVDVGGGISDFILATSIEVNFPFAAAFAKRTKLGGWTFTEGSATVTGEIVGTNPPSGKSLGGSILKDTVAVSVAIITVTDIRVAQSNYFVLKEGEVAIAMTELKEGEADNVDNTLGNILTVWLSDGKTTKTIGITHQILNNRNLHSTAETTALSVAKGMAGAGYKVLAN